MTTTLAPPTVPIAVAAQRLGVHENTVRNWIDRGLLHGYLTPTGRRKLRLDSVERLEREMFGVPSPPVELTEPQVSPAHSPNLERAQGPLP
ncbi:MAG: helix-turn-helix domain-containing protein [Actinomycetota bacterium]|nr:helix-turn-helix domain-containing protein [Actinomycetota bacterium]